MAAAHRDAISDAMAPLENEGRRERPPGGRLVRPRALAATAIALALVSAAAPGYETDQYSNRSVQLADSVEQLNGEVNRALGDVAARWRHGDDPRRFARAVYRELGGRHWVDRLERWAIRSPQIDKPERYKRHNVYRGTPFWARRVGFFFGMGPTFEVAGARLGSDKLGHFVSQGWKYHKRYLRTGSEAYAVRLGVRNEASIFGSPFTGAFSNADLVANHEGFLFYRSLFEDGVVDDRPGDHRVRRLRSASAPAVRLPRPRQRLLGRGAQPEPLRPAAARADAASAERPLRPVPGRSGAMGLPRDAELRARYSHLGMRDGTTHRLDRVCETESRGTAVTAAAAQPR